MCPVLTSGRYTGHDATRQVQVSRKKKPSAGGSRLERHDPIRKVGSPVTSPREPLSLSFVGGIAHGEIESLYPPPRIICIWIHIQQCLCECVEPPASQR